MKRTWPYSFGAAMKIPRACRVAPAFRERLAVLPGWGGKPRVEADEERWGQRLAELKEGSRWIPQ